MRLSAPKSLRNAEQFKPNSRLAKKVGVVLKKARRMDCLKMCATPIRGRDRLGRGESKARADDLDSKG
jgi:hypothetical protein